MAEIEEEASRRWEDVFVGEVARKETNGLCLHLLILLSTVLYITRFPWKRIGKLVEKEKLTS